jgi:hypothetical protein
MTLYSFRKFNPDWDITLYLSNNGNAERTWNGWEEQDFFAYKGTDYLSKLESLNIKIEKAILPNGIGGLSQIHESDIFRYFQLCENGGFYSDMDVLYFRSIETYYNKVSGCDAVFHQDRANVTIGFMGSSVGNALYKNIFDFASANIDQSDYQSMGVLLIYKMFRGQGTDSQILDKIRIAYPQMNIQNLPSNLLYEYDWSKVNFNFSHAIPAKAFSPDAIGYHWYGGNPLSQKWNNVLNETNYKDHITTFSELCKQIL